MAAAVERTSRSARRCDERSERDPHPDALALRRRAAPRRFDAAPPRAAGRAAHERQARARRRRDAGLPARDARVREGDWQVAPRRPPTTPTAASRSPARPTARWSSTRSTRARAASWPTSRTPTRRPGRNHGRRPRQPDRRDRAARSSTPSPTAASTRWPTRRRRCWSARAAGTSPSATCSSTASRVAGALLDFGLFAFHDAPRPAGARRRRPYLYLPKLEHHLEARLWNDVFELAQDALGLPRGTIRATVLIETLPAAFQMDEILYELRDHSARAQRRPLGLHLLDDQVLPRAARVRAPRPHRREDDRAVHARLHRAAGQDLPRPRRPRDGRHGRADPVAARTPRPTQRAIEAVRADKQREAGDGFDGTWVAHPDVGAASRREAFDAVLGERAQPDRAPARRRAGHGRASCSTSAATPGDDHRGRACATTSTSASSTSRPGCAATARPAIYSLMEDAATAEISRSQVWQWIRHGARRSTTAARSPRARARLRDRGARAHPRARSATTSGSRPEGRPALSRELFEQVALADDFVDFLTLPAYERLED